MEAPFLRHELQCHGQAVSCLLVGTFLSACAQTPIFPPAHLQNLERGASFRDLAASPWRYHDRLVEVGGEIVESKVIDGEVQILVRALPVRITPLYGPDHNGRSKGLAVIRYAGTAEAQDVQDGNMIVAIGVVQGVASAEVGDSVRRLTITAECVHTWRTQRDGIHDFPWLGDSLYGPLIEQTYCVNEPNVNLPAS
jgi:starvation-inducible outer membrane lipoprotein